MFKEIKAQKTRLILAIFSVAWGTASIAFMLSIGEGLRLSFMKQASSGGMLTLAAQPVYTTKNYEGMPNQSQVFFKISDTKKLTAISGVKMVTPTINFSAETRRGKRTANSSPLATTPAYQVISSIDVQPGGRFINELDMQKNKKVAFIGDQVAAWLFPNFDNPVGMAFKLGGQVFTIIGVSKKSMGFGSYNGSLSTQVIIPLSTYFLLTSDSLVSQFVLWLYPGVHIKKIEKSILTVFSKEQNFSPDDKNAIQFADSQASAKVVNTFTMGFQIFLGIIGGMSLLVSGVGVANIMYMSIKRAIRIIGTQMAIGANYGDILFHYFLEAMLITLSGGIFGILATLGIVELLDLIPIQSKIYLELGSPRPVLSWGVLISVIVVLGVIGFFSSFFPARNAARTQPAVALREEG
jgi:putative ABC transport system permease protein